jgi:hypothetical protein
MNERINSNRGLDYQDVSSSSFKMITVELLLVCLVSLHMRSNYIFIANCSMNSEFEKYDVSFADNKQSSLFLLTKEYLPVLKVPCNAIFVMFA